MTDETATQETIITEDPIITQIVAEAKAGFNLTARLQGRALRTGSITVYTDEIAGEKYKAIDLKLQQISDSAANLKKLAEAARNVGLEAGAVALETEAGNALANTDLAAYAALETEQEAVKAELDASSLTFELRAVPEIIVKDTRRKSNLALSIKGPVPEDRQDEWGEYFTALLLTQVIRKVTDHATGDSAESISLEDARSLGDYLPLSQFQRLSVKMADVQYKNSISDSVTAEADF